MEIHLLHIFTFLSLALVGSHADLPPEAYWKSVLPNTPMPKAVKDLLLPAGVVKGGISVGTDGEKAKEPCCKKRVGKKCVKKCPPLIPTPVPVYKYVATEDQVLHDNPIVDLFFMEKDMHQGEKMKLHFVKSRSQATFLPRQVAKTVPFFSTRFLEILNRFSVEPHSMEAEIMKKTIKECEEKGTKGGEKYCATSLESMIDFSTSKLGKKVNAISTEVEKETEVQRYTIEGVEPKMAGDKAAIVCHKQNYVYAVFYCYKTSSVKAYKVSLVGDDGTKAEAVAVCHEDTSAWNPNHLAFQMLKVKPGSVPVCNFLPEDNIVWVPY
ncbi:hypothetical protein LguiA_033037 [Lonicera macranthoides]